MSHVSSIVCIISYFEIFRIRGFSSSRDLAQELEACVSSHPRAASFAKSGSAIEGTHYMKWLNSLFGRTTQGSQALRPVTHGHPLVIPNPKIGFLNLVGTSARPLVDEDTAALKPLFADCLEGDSSAPICDMLMIYATVEADGLIQNSSLNLREIIHQVHAPIVVIATENDVQTYIAASKRPGLGKANLVMTLKRNGQSFPKFFKDLFGMMHHGVTMPMAWVKLVPQIPGMKHENVPETICAMEVTHVLFN
jgi:hypothetical protein